MKITYFPREEERILGAALFSKNVLYTLIQKLEDVHFYDPAHCAIFQSLKEMYNANLDVNFHSLKTWMHKKGEWEKNQNAVASIIANASAHSFDSDLSAIKHAYHQGRIADVIRQATTGGHLQPIEAIAEICSQHLNDRKEKITHSIGDLLGNFENRKTYMETLEMRQEEFLAGRRVRGIPTGFAALDEAIRGLNDSFYIILAGTPGSGKTTFAIQVISNVIDSGKKVGFISLEMTKEQVIDKIFSIRTDTKYTNISEGNFSGIDFHKYGNESQKLKQLNSLYIEEVPVNNKTALRARMKYLVERLGCNMLCIDYVGLIKDDGNKGTMHEIVTGISHTIRETLKELRIPGLILCQLNRNAKNDEPQIFHLRDSGQLEQDCHQCLMLWRPNNEAESEAIDNRVFMFIRKSRFSAQTKIVYHFNGNRFEEYAKHVKDTCSMIENINENYCSEYESND